MIKNKKTAPVMIFLMLFVIFICLPICSADYRFDHSWSNAFGDENGQVSTGLGMDSVGNSVIFGFFAGTVNFGGELLTSVGGSNDICLAKFDPQGTHIWSASYGDAAAQESVSGVVDHTGAIIDCGVFAGTLDFDGVPLTSDSGSDVFLVKFDASGNHLWSAKYTGTQTQQPVEVCVDSDNNIIMAGIFNGTVDFGGGPMVSAGTLDIFLVKFSSDGAHLWSMAFGDAEFDVANCLTIDSANNIIMSGGFFSAIDFGGGSLSSGGSNDIFMVKFNPFGEHQWSMQFDDADDSIPYSLTTDSDDNIIAAGSFAELINFGGVDLTADIGDPSNLFLVKFSSTGAHIWSRGDGDLHGQAGECVRVDESDNIFMVGDNFGDLDLGGGVMTSAGGPDVFLAMFDPSGAHQVSQCWGDSALQLGYSVCIGPNNNVLIAGDLFGSVDFGGGPVSSDGWSNIFVAGFNVAGYPTPTPTPTPVPECASLGCAIEMPAVVYRPGDPCYLLVHICNPDNAAHADVPVFTILDIFGQMFFAPTFTEFDHYTETLEPGLTTVEVIPAFNWPDNAGEGSGVIVYAAMTDPDVTALFGDLDSFSFGWRE